MSLLELINLGFVSEFCVCDPYTKFFSFMMNYVGLISTQTIACINLFQVINDEVD